MYTLSVWTDVTKASTFNLPAGNRMVNIGLTRVDDALAAKHPVGFRFYLFHSLLQAAGLLWTHMNRLLTWNGCLSCVAKAAVSLSGFGELRRLSVSRLHEGDWDVYTRWVTMSDWSNKKTQLIVRFRCIEPSQLHSYSTERQITTPKWALQSVPSTTPSVLWPSICLRKNFTHKAF